MYSLYCVSVQVRASFSDLLKEGLNIHVLMSYLFVLMPSAPNGQDAVMESLFSDHPDLPICGRKMISLRTTAEQKIKDCALQNILLNYTVPRGLGCDY